MRIRSALLGAALLTLVSALDVRAQTGGQSTVQFSAPAKSTAAWTSATSNNTALTVTLTNLSKVIITLNATSTMTAGTLNFEADDGSGTWWAIPATRTAGASVNGAAETTFALSVVNQAWEIDLGGWAQVRVRLSPAITGSGTANVAILPTASEGEPSVTASQPNAANLNATVTVTGTVTAQPPANTPDLANALSTTVHTTNATAARLEGYYCYNPNATVAYVQVFDISGTVTLGTSTPKLSLGLLTGANNAVMDVNFANAIKVAATTTATGSTAPGTAVDCNFWYR